jgi:calcineurin-like phosphoesterase family protein
MTSLCGRPDNFTELIIENWKKIVQPDDHVVHCGDVILGRESELRGLMSNLPGKIHLVKGNHDHKPKQYYYLRGFEWVHDDYYILDGVLFTHRPWPKAVIQAAKTGDYSLIPSARVAACVLADSNFARVRCNVHGHLHNTGHRSSELGSLYDPEFNKVFALEWTGYAPVELGTFIFSHDKYLGEIYKNGDSQNGDKV